MSLKSFIQRFLLHCIWALSTVVFVMLTMEFFIPGSVTPYVDPLPWAILAMIALVVDAMLRPVSKRRWLRLVVAAIFLILSILIITSGIQVWGKSTGLLILVMTAMVGFTGWFVSSGAKG